MASSRDLREETMQQLGDVTNSSAELNKASIIIEASKYIQELKQKVDGLNSELGIIADDEMPPMEVNVKSVKNGFMISVVLEKNCPGVLVSILEAFEELGLDVLDARVSCQDTFQLQAVGGESHKKESVDAQVVKQAVLRAINNTN